MVDPEPPDPEPATTSPDPRRETERVAVYIGVAGGALFLATLAFIAVVQTLAPLFGLAAGGPSDTLVVLMFLFASVALGILPAAALASVVRSRRNGGSS